ncbi:MAG: hypothetical protein AB7N80_02590 [Bdellovibrionales bacterium]
MLVNPSAISATTEDAKAQASTARDQLLQQIGSLATEPTQKLPALIKAIAASEYNFVARGEQELLRKFNLAIQYRTLDADVKASLDVYLALNYFYGTTVTSSAFMEDRAFFAELVETNRLLYTQFENFLRTRPDVPARLRFLSMLANPEKMRMASGVASLDLTGNLPNRANYLSLFAELGMVVDETSLLFAMELLERVVTRDVNGGLSRSWYYRLGQSWALGFLPAASPSLIIKVATDIVLFPLQRLVLLEEVLRTQIYKKFTRQQFEALLERLAYLGPSADLANPYYPDATGEYLSQMTSLRSVLLSEYESLQKQFGNSRQIDNLIIKVFPPEHRPSYIRLYTTGIRQKIPAPERRYVVLSPLRTSDCDEALVYKLRDGALF